MTRIKQRWAMPSHLQATLRLLVWTEPYLLPFVALVPLFLPNPHRPAAAVMVVVFAILRRPVLGHIIRRTPLDLPVGLIIAGAIIGTLVSPARDFSVEMLWGYMGAVAMFYLIVTRRSDANLWSYMLWLVGFPLLVAGLVWGVTWAKDASSLAALLQAISDREQTVGGFGYLFSHEALVGGPWTYQQIGRLFPIVTSWTTSANDLAWIYSFAFPFLLGGTLRGRWTSRLLWLLPALILAAALTLTGSRAGFLGLGAGCLGVLAARWHRPWLALWLLLLPVSLLILGWLGLQSVPWLAIPDANGVARVSLWHSSFSMVGDFLYTGVGLGTWPIAYKLLYAGDSAINNPHNVFLQTYLDLGPLGLVGLLWLVLWGLRVAFTPAVEESWTRSWIRIGLAGAWLAFVVQGSFEATSTAIWADGSVYHGVVSPIPWTLAALSVVCSDAPQASASRGSCTTDRVPNPMQHDYVGVPEL